MAYLAAVSSSTMPIFIRTKGDVPPWSFPILGSLHSIQIFASELQTSLLSCSTSSAKVVWKQYCSDSISLILVTSDTVASESHLSHMLDLIFNAMVLLIGLHELENVSKNTSSIQKLLKCCYPLIDFIFKEEHTLFSPLTQAVDVIALEDTSLLSRTLDVFIEVAKSSFGCLSVYGRVCVASECWWNDLSPLETSLLSLFLCSLPPASSRDIPIYLPKASNKVAHRLVIFTLFEGVHLSIICNPEPPLTALQEQLSQYWTPLATQLKTSIHTVPRNIPLGLTLEPCILAFCLVNVETSRSLTSLRPTAAGDHQKAALTPGYRGEMKVEKRYSYLSRFYKTISGDILPLSKSSEQSKESSLITSTALFNRIPHTIRETYICSKNYKAYAMNKDNYNLFVLFTASSPTFTLKKMTSILHETLIQDRTIAVL